MIAFVRSYRGTAGILVDYDHRYEEGQFDITEPPRCRSFIDPLRLEHRPSGARISAQFQTE